MKKPLFSLFLLAFLLQTYAQSTYYWIRDNSGTADWNTAADWNTKIDGSGSPRSAPATDDILIFDGTNFVNKTVSFGLMPEVSIGSLQIKGGITLVIASVEGWPAAVSDALSTTVYGGSTYSVTGNTGTFTNLKPGDVLTTESAINNPMDYVQVLAIRDGSHMTVSKEQSSGSFNGASAYYKVKTLYTNQLFIGAGSTLQLGPGGGSFISYVVNTKGGSVEGTVQFASRGGHCKLVCTTPNNGDPAAGLRFKNGAECIVNTSTSGKNNYNLGATLGDYAGDVFIHKDGSGNNNKTPGYQGVAGIVFEAGSTFTLGAGDNLTAFGPSVYSTGELSFTPAVSFSSGSNYVHNLGRTGLPYFYTGQDVVYPNLEIKNGYPSNLTLGRVENLKISGGITADVGSNTGLVLASGSVSNTTPYKVNFGHVIMHNPADAQIGGSGQGNIDFSTLTVADRAVVTLGQNITATNVHLLGRLNFSSYTITGTNTGVFATYSPYSKQANSSLTSGSNLVGGINQSGRGTTEYDFPIGASVSNPNLAAGTIYKEYAGTGNGMISSYAQATAAEAVIDFLIQGSSYTTSGAALASAAPAFNLILDVNYSNLPLDPISFGGKLFANNVSLHWKTVNETDVSFFGVEKRDDTAPGFQEIGRVNAKNTNYNTYVFNDPVNSGPSTSYYRLRMVDNDGTTKFSDIVAVKSGMGTLVTELKVYPNPVTEQLVLVHPPVLSSADIVVYASDGRAVLSQPAELNSVETRLDVSKFAKGIYFLVHKNHPKTSLKFIKD